MPLTVTGIATPIPPERVEFITKRAGGFDFLLKVGICTKWLASIARHPKAKAGDRITTAYGDILITKAQAKADLGSGLDAGPHLRRAGLQPEKPLTGPASGFGAAVGKVAHKEGAALMLVRTELASDYPIGIYRTAKKIVLFAPGAGELAPIPIKYAARDIDAALDLGRDKVAFYIGYTVTAVATAATGPQEKAPPPPVAAAGDDELQVPPTGATAAVVEQEPIYAVPQRDTLPAYVPPPGTTAHIPPPGIIRRNK